MDLFSCNKVREGALEFSVFNLCVFSLDLLKQREVNSLSKDTQVLSGRSSAIIFDDQREYVVTTCNV